MHGKTPSRVFSDFGYAVRKMLKIYPEALICNTLKFVISDILLFLSNTYMLRYIVNGIQNGLYTQVIYLAEYAKELHLTNISRVMQRNFTDSVKELIRTVKTDGVKVAFGLYTVNNLGQTLSNYGAEIYAVYRTLVSNAMMVGDCLIVLKSSLSLTSLKAIARWYSEIYDISLNIRDFRDFAENEPAVSQNPNGETAQKGDIVLRCVSFRYDGAESDTLTNVNMTIKKGEKVCIVGRNGAGKTTLVKLLMRLYDVTEGEISVAGRNIKEYDLESYRDSHGAVFQDYKQMSLSVAENVLGRPFCHGDEERVASSLKKAGLWEKVSSDEGGIHSVMTREFSNEGLVFSGGEAQKLSIASVYAKDCNIVILDEPSSALGPIAEHEMYENMRKACEDKTVIFISHRLSATRYVDRIYMFEDGRVIESGSHGELMALDGKYAQMFKVQTENYTVLYSTHI